VARQQGDVIEVDQSTGTIIRTVGSVPGATGIATDPLSGDLFVSEVNMGVSIARIANPASSSPTTSVYSSPGNSDGVAFGPDGTLYVAVFGARVDIIAGTNTAQPGQILTSFSDSAINGADGIALLPPPPGSTSSSIVVNTTVGTMVKIDNPSTTPTYTNIFSGGTRGDFVTVGPDHCLYATQSAAVLKVTSMDGSCPFIPSICLTNPAVPQVHVSINGFTFTYNDSGQALNGAGVDGECTGNNESQGWEQIGGKGGPVNLPLPPAVTLALQAARATGHVVGQSQAFTVAAMDGAPVTRCRTCRCSSPSLAPTPGNSQRPRT